MARLFIRKALVRNDSSRLKGRVNEAIPACLWMILISCLGLVGLLGLPADSTRAQNRVSDVQTEIDYTFGERITFRMRFPSELSITSVDIFFEANSGETIVGTAAFTGEVWEYEHEVQNQNVRAFGMVVYWFRVTVASGETQETAMFSFFYEDNRFDWQTLAAEPIRVHWYEGDTAFAQTILDTARAGAQQAGLILDTEFSKTVEVYVYGKLTDYQFVRKAMGPQWAGGHADPELGIVVVSLPPGESQALEAERKIPHEIAHLILYQATGKGFRNLPAWLNEGFASTQERNPNPDYQFLVSSAVQKGTLIPLTTLCQPFPPDAAGAVLSYAEATAFVRYLQQRFGQEGLRAVVHAYANGSSCELGTNVAPVNLPLSQLELEWREGELAENVTLTALRKFVPWLILLGAVVAGPVLVAVSFRKPNSVTNP